MSKQPSERQFARTAFSRRGFLETAALAAASTAMVRVWERTACAVESADKISPTSQHPLDPLSVAEMRAAVDLLRKAGKVVASLRFVSCALAEPAKECSSTGVTPQSVPRQAFLVLLDNATGTAYEALVDLDRHTVLRFEALPKGIHPPMMFDEFSECEEAVKRSPPFLAALAKRGLNDASLLMVEPWAAGHYGNEPAEDRGRRLARALCFVRSEPNDNGFARPLDGVVAVVDLNRMEVLRVEDQGTVPLPPESGNWARQFITPAADGPKPLSIVQPEGASFVVDGHMVRWQKWQFRVGFTPREGLVLYNVAFTDEGRRRPILHRASICEMVVPYGDPTEKSYRKNAFDIGEYGIGTLANSLKLGCDCLGTIHYFDADIIDSRGQVLTLKNVVCLHEEDVGLLWKHTDWRTNQTEMRRARRLSVSFVATVGNYDYAFFWHFWQDGTIQCEIKLTGIMNTTALDPEEKPSFGVEVAPRLNAPFHQHIFAARLDMSVDGPHNSVYEVNTVGLPRSAENPHGNAFRAETTLLATEHQAQREVSSATARFWRIANPSRKNRLGQPVAYRLVPGENCPPFVQPDASVMRRAGFMAHHLWVTPFNDAERYAAGDYPNQHPGGAGLPEWTAGNRNIEEQDLVVWYVFAHNHVPRPEDWPVMAVGTIGFTLKPDGFFRQNPSMDLPPPV